VSRALTVRLYEFARLPSTRSHDDWQQYCQELLDNCAPILVERA
jgi:hypothetical protein